MTDSDNDTEFDERMPLPKTISLNALQKLDARPESLLDWQVAQGSTPLLFDLDLGLFTALKHPLSSPVQFQALTFSIKHFRETIWPACRERTIGLNLYSGPATLSFEEREFLQLLALQVPDALSLFYTLDMRSVDSKAESAWLLHSDHFPHAELIVKGAKVPFVGYRLEGEEAIYVDDEAISEAICLPSLDVPFSNYQERLEALIANHPKARLIPESSLSARWDGLDIIFVFPDFLAKEAKRTLNGFAAAGGIIESDS